MVLADVVLLGVVAVLVVVLLLQPRAPYVAVRAASLGVLPLAYVGCAHGAPLGDAGSAAMETALRDGVVPFRVEGEARTRWKVAGIVGIDQWTRLACQLGFFWPNDIVLPFRCSSKSKLLFF
uniref:Late embryogenesis abundant protein n=1 Tax=Zea mays TaxID=4577 RepID=A0A804NA56_MAIZE